MGILQKLLGSTDITKTRENRVAQREQLLNSVPEAKARIIEVSSARECPPSPEIFEELCVCAVRDRPYIVRYARQRNGKFRAESSRKVTGASGGSIANGPLNATLPIDRFEGGISPCPWCGGLGHYHCSCGAILCGGRLAGNLFTCRDSCGRQWRPDHPVSELKGSLPQDAARLRATHRAPEALPPAPAGTSLKLLR
jgi:hypothetical protein